MPARLASARFRADFDYYTWFRKSVKRSEKRPSLRLFPRFGAHQRQDLFEIVLGRRFINFLLSAALAAMSQDDLAAAQLSPNRGHQSAAAGRPVSRRQVDMFRVKTDRTVICITVSGNRRAAIFAREIFRSSNKRHRDSSRPIRPLSFLFRGAYRGGEFLREIRQQVKIGLFRFPVELLVL